MSESNFKKLQRVQNTLARVVLRRGKYEHITPALVELQWFPIKQSVTFKIATTIFKIRYLHQPTYLLDLLNHYTPTRSLRSSSQLLLQNNPTRTVLSDTLRIRRLKLFGHVARADKSQDHSRALQDCISPAPRNWRRRPGRPRHTWLRTVEEDLRQFNLGLASGLLRAQNRTAWRALTGTATSPTSSD